MASTFFELVAGEALPINLPEGVWFVGALAGIDGIQGQVPTIDPTGSVIWATPGDIPGSGGAVLPHAASHEAGGSDIIELGKIVGVLINTQVPVNVVTQHQAALSIAFNCCSSINN